MSSVTTGGGNASDSAGGRPRLTAGTMSGQEFVDLENVPKKTEYVANQFDVHLARRRGEPIKGEEKKSYQSNYNHLLEMIRMDTTNKNKSEDSFKPTNLGPILEAKKEEEAKERALERAKNKKRSSKASKLRGAVHAVRSVAKTSSLVWDKQEEVVPPTESQAQKAEELARTATGKNTSGTEATQKAQNRMAQFEQNQNKSHEFDQMLAEAVDTVRPQLARRRSWPHSINNLGLLQESHEELKEVKDDNDHLRDMINGTKPREQELELQKKIGSLETQILNQMALIKGLREKLKIAQRSGGGTDIGSAVATGFAGTGMGSSDPNANSILGASQSASFGRGGVATPPQLANTQTQASSSLLLNQMKSIPVGDSTTVVFVDVQSSQYLREAMPDIMPSQVALYVRILRECANPLNGYEVRHMDDRFQFAFHTPLDACKWCAEVQLRLTQVDWNTELCENADTPSELLPGGNNTTDFLWRGLRVSMGMQIGVQAQKDPFNGSVTYEGTAVHDASFLQQIAAGGEILFMESVNQHVCGPIANLGVGLIQPWDSLGAGANQTNEGDVVSTQKRGAARKVTGLVYRFVPTKLKDRLRGFQRDLAAAEKYHLDMNMFRPGAPPPTGNVSLVTVMPVAMKMLMDNTTEAVRNRTLETYDQVFDQALKDSRGYLSRSEDSTRRSLVAFQNCVDAVRFSLRLQQDLLKREWPQELQATMSEFFGHVNLKGTVLFSGIRLKIGVHTGEFTDVVDTLTTQTIYQGPDSMMCSNLALSAVDGETLVSSAVLDEVTQHSEALGSPAIFSAISMSIATRDAQVQTFQIFPKHLSARSAYTSREQKLGDEPPDTHRAAVTSLEKQIQTLQVKLEAKDKWIGHLEEQVREKSSLIGELRSTVAGLPFKNINFKASQERLTKPSSILQGSETALMALSFAHADELYEAWAEEMPAAMEVFDNFIESSLIQNHGHEVRRSPSGVIRIIQFIDAHYAGEFWLSLQRNLMHLDWPSRLDDSDHAGAAMASDYIQDIHRTLEGLVWKGFRPIAALDVGVPQTYLNPTTLVPDIIGEQVNFVSLLLRECSEGDCILSSMAQISLESQQAQLTEGIIQEYGAYHRLLAGDMKMRNRIIRQFFPGEAIDTESPAHTENAAVVHILRQKSPFLLKSEATKEPGLSAIQLYDTTILKLAEGYDGTVISTNGADYTIVFPDKEKGAEFAIYVHTALVNAPWDPAILRCADFKEIIADRQLLFKGIRAAVGFHLIEDASVSTDMFSGLDIWVHEEMGYSTVLAHNAHFGETVMSEVAKLVVHRIHGKRVKAYTDTIGSMNGTSDPLPVTLYQGLPSLLKGRVVCFFEDDRNTNDPDAAEKRQKAQKHEVVRRTKLVEEMTRDKKVLGDMERNINPLDTISKRFKKLYLSIKERVDEDRGRYMTSMSTLQVCETASMMAEDPFYLDYVEEGLERTKPKEGVPTQISLIMHQLEYGHQVQHPSFSKAYAAELVSGQSATMLGGGGRHHNHLSTTTPSSNPLGGGADLDPLADSTNGDMDSSRSKQPGEEIRAYNGIQPEDVAQVHIDVERFSNLLLLHGVENLPAIISTWLGAVYEDCIGPTGGEGLTDDDKLKELGTKTESLGMDLGSIDVDKMRVSIVANLSNALNKLRGDGGDQSASFS